MEAQGPKEPGRIEKRLVGAIVKGFFLRGRRSRPRTLPSHLPLRALAFRGNSGARLAGWHLDTPDARGIVVLVHPDRRYASHWFVREGWLDFLHANRLAALGFDFPAYGASRGGSTYFHDDVLAAAQEARRLHPALPLHVVGLSIGAFAVANAAPRLAADSLVLESPYPTFADWYSHADAAPALGRLNASMARIWPRTARRIDAGRNVAQARTARILVAATPEDEVTPIHLSRRVADAAPAGRTRWLEVPHAQHLGLFRSAAYRQALLETWLPGATPEGGSAVSTGSAPAAAAAPAAPAAPPPAAQALISHLA